MSIYTPTARFDTGRPLTEDELRVHAPSIFATTAHESRSQRFRPIPTIDVLRALQREGFHPVGARQAKARDEGRADHAKHMIRLRRFDNVKAYRVGDTVCEIILKNANDGTSAYDLLAGLFRIACLNSLVARTGTIDAVKVKHAGDVASKVIEGTYRVLGEAQTALSAPQDWSRLNLSGEAREAFAYAAHGLRFGDADGKTDTLIAPAQLLHPRRADDQRTDLWTTFNVVQENAIKGGLVGIGWDEQGRPHRSRTREVRGIDQDVRLNKALWALSDHMAKILRTAA